MIRSKVRHFYSTINVARALGISRRTVDRIADAYRIEPMVIKGGGVRLRHFYLRNQLPEFRRHLKEFA